MISLQSCTSVWMPNLLFKYLMDSKMGPKWVHTWRCTGQGLGQIRVSWPTRGSNVINSLNTEFVNGERWQVSHCVGCESRVHLFRLNDPRSIVFRILHNIVSQGSIAVISCKDEYFSGCIWAGTCTKKPKLVKKWHKFMCKNFSEYCTT